MVSTFLLRRSSHRTILYRSSKSLFIGGGASKKRGPSSPEPGSSESIIVRDIVTRGLNRVQKDESFHS